jgi:hypothetical protein
MGDAGPAGQLPEADRGRSDFGDRLNGGLHQGAWEVAVVVGPSILAGAGSCGHFWIIDKNLAIDKILGGAYLDTDKTEVSEVQQ